MGVEIGGIVEESHEDEEGRRMIDKVKVEYLSLIPDNGIIDALGFLGDDYIIRMPPVREYTVRAKIKSIEKARPPNLVVEDEVRDAMEACGLDDECCGCRYGSCDTCPSPITFLDKIRYWTFDDWKDWLMGR